MITISNLTYGYSAKKTILENINTSFEKGHIYGLLGKNGEGKTTLLRLIAGLIHDKGNIKIDGIKSSLRETSTLQKIRLVSETESTPNVTPMEWAKIEAPFYPTFDYSLYEKSLKELEVPTDSKLSKMSMGQRKKAIIAMALACNTPYLIMDEPTNGLDIPSKAVFRRLVAESMNDNKTIIISTHQVDDIESLIDSVVILNNKVLIANNTISEIGKAFSFGIAEEGEKALYSEPTVAGVISMKENTTSIESSVNLKVFFTALVVNKITEPLAILSREKEKIPAEENINDISVSTESKQDFSKESTKETFFKLLKYDAIAYIKPLLGAFFTPLLVFLTILVISMLTTLSGDPSGDTLGKICISSCMVYSAIMGIVVFFLLTALMLRKKFTNIDTATTYMMLPASTSLKITISLLLYVVLIPFFIYGSNILSYNISFLVAKMLRFDTAYAMNEALVDLKILVPYLSTNLDITDIFDNPGKLFIFLLPITQLVYLFAHLTLSIYFKRHGQIKSTAFLAIASNIYIFFSLTIISIINEEVYCFLAYLFALAQIPLFVFLVRNIYKMVKNKEIK